MIRRTTAILLTFLLSPSAFGQTVYPLRQYLSVRGAAGPSLSPDGKQITFQTNITGTAQVWKAPRTTSPTGAWPEQLTFLGSSVNSATYSPTQNEILVVADTDGNEQFQFYLLEQDGKKLTPLTGSPKVRHAFGGWSQDGKQIFYAANGRDPRYFDCYLMNIATRQTRLVFQKDAILDAAALSPDGKTLAVVDSLSNVNNDIYLVEVASGKARHVTPHQGDANFSVVGFSADNRTLYITSNAGRDFVNLESMEVESGKITPLQGENYDLAGATLSPDRHLLAYTTNRDGYTDLTLWDLKANKPLRLPKLPRGLVTIGNFAADSRTLAIALNTPTRNGDVWTLDIPAVKASPQTFSSLAGINPETFVEPSLIRYRSFDGKEIPAFLYLPKNAGTDHNLPVILSVHGGPEGQEQPRFNALYQYFVSRGYAVLAPNIRGSSGYGKTYLAMDNASKRWDALKDLSAAVDWTGTHPALNARKVAIIGGSYGGFAVLAMLAHYPERFAAGVDMFGIADFKSFLANTAPFRRPLRIAEYGDPVQDSEFLDAISPARHVDKIAAPLMVIQGANDPRVPESESAQIVQKVKAKGGKVEYLLFPDEGHGLAKLPNRIKAYEQMVAFLDKVVKGQ